MDKYRETKDPEEVRDAIKKGLRVEDLGTRVKYVDGYLVREEDGCTSVMPTLPGRIFRIELPKHDFGPGWRELEPGEEVRNGDSVWTAPEGVLGIHWFASFKQHHSARYARKVEEPKFTGPTVELTPKLLARMLKHCEATVEQGGACHGLNCDDCPGRGQYNNDVLCNKNGWTTTDDAKEPDPVAEGNAARFLAEHPMTESPRDDKLCKYTIEVYQEEVKTARASLAAIHFYASRDSGAICTSIVLECEKIMPELKALRSVSREEGEMKDCKKCLPAQRMGYFQDLAERRGEEIKRLRKLCADRPDGIEVSDEPHCDHSAAHRWLEDIRAAGLEEGK